MAATAARTPYEPVIGLEVHAQLKVRTKLFCACPTRFGSPPNTNVCPVCLGLPGALPVLNRAAVEVAVKMAIAVGCAVQTESIFARKNYFYPDLPKGYQISQFERPFATGGRVEAEVDGQELSVRLVRIHLEEDAGKSIHEGYADSDRYSYLDFNRAGVPLCEIVSEPDIRSPAQAHAYLVRLRSILTYLDVCDGNMEEGSLRCDANVSLRPAGTEPLGTRTELKNLNSFRNVQRALEYEIDRQRELLEAGEAVVQQTRLYDADTGVTRSMRSKEESHDYRYFPEPDLLPLVIPREQRERLAAGLPELPGARKRRFVDELGLSEAAAHFLTLDRAVADYLEEAIASGAEARIAANWVMGDLMRLLNDRKIGIADSPVPAARLGKLIRMIGSGTLSGKIAKEVFQAMVEEAADPETIVEARGLAQISDAASLAPVVARVIADNPTQVEQYRAGKTKVFGYLVGQLMKATRGQANPELAGKLLREALEGD